MFLIRNITKKRTNLFTFKTNEWRSIYTSYGKLGAVREIELEHTAYPNNALRHHSEIPGPKRYPIVKCIPSIVLHKDYSAAHLQKFWTSLFNEYGTIVKINTIMAPTIVGVWKPEDIETIYRNTMENPVRFGFSSLKKVRDETQGNFFQQKTGILAENEEEWKRVRTKVQTPMLRPKNLIKYLSAMDNVSLEFVEKIYDLRDETGELPSNFLEEIYKWALESVSVVALNRRLGCLEKNLSKDSLQVKLIDQVNEIFDALNDTEWKVKFWKLFPTPSIRRLQRSHDNLVRIISPLINEAERQIRENPSAEDGPTTLMETLLNTPGLGIKDVFTIVLDMLTAGIDTTSHTIAFALYLLAKNEDAQRKVQKELDAVLGDPKNPISESHLAHLSYLKLCVKESLRIFPLVLGTPRVLQEDAVLSGYVVPKGWVAMSCNMITTKQESVFVKAKEFIPERWGKDKPFGPIHPFASLPFSHGPRMCIGRRIAEQEIYILLARLLQRYDVKYKHKDIELKTRLVSVPTEPLKFQIVRRK